MAWAFGGIKQMTEFIRSMILPAALWTIIFYTSDVRESMSKLEVKVEYLENKK